MTEPTAAASVQEPYPPIGDYALIGDCHSSALVSVHGSIDWCCMPRMDSASTFGRILDWERGGHCSVSIEGSTTTRAYHRDTMVLETVFRTTDGEARLTDCFTMRAGGRREPYRQLLRVIEVLHGRVTVDVEVAARFDYGGAKPWIRQHGPRLFSALGGNDAIVVSADFDIGARNGHDLVARIELNRGERARLDITAYPPEQLDPRPPRQADAVEIDRRLQATIEWWQNWAKKSTLEGLDGDAARRSALVLKALINAPTGAVLAAPTTSLPEVIGGPRNWDYRYSWIRDSQFSVRSLGELGFDNEADGFRRFVERTTAGSPEDLQIMYGVDGSRRLTEEELPLEGYRRSKPVRIGNAASQQVQLDVYGELLDLAWRWHCRGHSPDDDYWGFLSAIVNAAAKRWDKPDQSLWEIRGDPQHFVHSKVMCWAALDSGISLAKECDKTAPLEQWSKVRDEIRRSIEANGLNRKRNIYVRAYGDDAVDSALLLLPSVGYVAYDDPRMIATTDVIAEQLDHHGLLLRYRSDDGLSGDEGVFVACTFWLAECYAYQGRTELARAAFERARATSNDLGLFAEEYDAVHHAQLGNFPQGLSHLSHISAAVALARGPGNAT